MKQGEDKKAIFETMPVRQALTVMCVPAIIGQMVVLVYNLADTFFIGRTGNPYMVAATSLVLPVFNLSNAMSNFVGIGAGSLFSRLLGQHNEKEASLICAWAFWIGLAVSAAYSLLILLLNQPILNLLGASSQTFAYAKQYLLMVSACGGIPTILQLTMSQLLRAAGCSKEAGFGISMGGILNMILDPLFMFVLLPEGNEVLGAGLATMLSNTAAFVYFLIIFHLRHNQTALTLSVKQAHPQHSSIMHALQGGIPAGMSNLLFDFSQVMINKLMSGYGDVALAAIGIVLKAERIPLNAGIGICQGMLPIVAYNYSSGNYARMKETMKKSRAAGLLIALAAVVFYELCAPSVMHAFINHADTAALGTSFLRARCLATGFMFLNFHMLYAFQAMGEARIASWLAVIRQLFLYIPFLILMNHLFGMYGLVWTQLVSDLIMTGVSFAIYRRFEKDKGIN